MKRTRDDSTFLIVDRKAFDRIRKDDRYFILQVESVDSLKGCLLVEYTYYDKF